MKKIIFLLLISSYSYSQDISYIETLDTIFVNFKQDNFQERFVFPLDYKGFRERWYTINFFDKEKKEFFKFFFMEYSNSEKRSMKIKSDVRIVKKIFLRKNKKKIIGIDFFKRYGIYKSTYEAFKNCKVIYIIDNSETRNGQITLYEVTKWSSYVMGE